MSDFAEITKVLPHRHPFLLVDKILELEAGVRCVGQKNVSYNDAFFQGHYPEYPVMPGVLIVEALAQVGAYLLLSNPDHQGKLPFFRGIEKAKFRKQVRPGDTLRLEVEVLKLRGNLGTAKGTAYVNGEVACHCEISFFV